MSYERDSNAHTRQPGAIAAYDQNPARQRRMAMGARASKIRDRKKVALMGLGATANRIQPGAQTYTPGNMNPGPAFGPTVGTGAGTFGMQPPSSSSQRLVRSSNIGLTASSTGVTKAGTSITGVPVTGGDAGTTTTGGGGGTTTDGTVTGTSGDPGNTGIVPPGIISTPPPPSDNIDDTGLEASASSGLDLTTLGIIAAVGVGAWYLFFRKKPGGA